MDFQQNGTITELLFVVSWEKETLMSSAKYKPLEISICRHGWSDSFNKSWECSLKLLRLQLTTKWLEAQNHTLNSWQSSIAANVLVCLCHQFIFVWYFFSSKKTCFLLALFWYCRELLSGDFNEARLVFLLNWCVVPATSQGHCVLITVIVVPANSRGLCESVFSNHQDIPDLATSGCCAIDICSKKTEWELWSLWSKVTSF